MGEACSSDVGVRNQAKSLVASKTDTSRLATDNFDVSKDGSVVWYTRNDPLIAADSAKTRHTYLFVRMFEKLALVRKARNSFTSESYTSLSATI